MRIHPEQVGGCRQIGLKALGVGSIAFLLLVLLTLMGHRALQFSASDREPAQLRGVVVANSMLQPFVPISAGSVHFEPRDADAVPAEAVQNVEEVIGRYPTRIVQQGEAITKPFLFQSGKVELEQNQLSEQQREEELERIRPKTVAVEAVFAQVPPPRGSKIAVYVSNKSGTRLPIVDRAWVEEPGPQSTRIRVMPVQAVFLREAAKLGQLSFKQLTADAPAPQSSELISDFLELKQRLSAVPIALPAQAQAAPEAPPSQTGDQQSRIWAYGDEQIYSIGSDGSIGVIGADGQLSVLLETAKVPAH